MIDCTPGLHSDAGKASRRTPLNAPGENEHRESFWEKRRKVKREAGISECQRSFTEDQPAWFELYQTNENQFALQCTPVIALPVFSGRVAATDQNNSYICRVFEALSVQHSPLKRRTDHGKVEHIQHNEFKRKHFLFRQNISFLTDRRGGARRPKMSRNEARSESLPENESRKI